jgi:endoglucanase
MAAEARFDLMADAAAGELLDAQVLSGAGTMTRMSWLPEKERPRGYVALFPVTHYAWREFAAKFTPRGDGTVTLTLLGPWEQPPGAAAGTIYRQELWWDAVRVTGSSLPNGSFEETGADGPAGWQRNGGTVEEATTAVPAVEGKRIARTWHNATLSTSLPVTAGKPVTIRLHARAVVPADYKEMRRVTGRDTPAHLAAKKFRHGINFCNYLEAPRGEDWGASYTKEDFRHAKAEGFDHVRLPIAWQHYAGAGPDYTLTDEIFRKADALVDAAVKEGLNVIVDIHHFDQLSAKPSDHADKFYALWKQIAGHYAKYPDGVAFELLNEPKDAATAKVLNGLYAEALKVIRKTNPRRTVLVGPGHYNSVGELPALQLPEDDLNLIVTVHSYDPFYFTHQGAEWAGPDTKVTGIRFPGPPARPLQIDPGLKVNPWVRDWVQRYNTLPAERNPSRPGVVREVVLRAKEWSDYFGRPVHFGEFGCFEKADDASRANYYRAFREALDEADVGWAAWDWKSGFRYWDAKKERPIPGLHEALFGKPAP